MRSIQALLATGLTAVALFDTSNAWLIQWWWEQVDTCASKNGVGVAGRVGGEPFQPSCSMVAGGGDGMTSMEISDWDPGCTVTIFNDSMTPDCVHLLPGFPTGIIWGPYTREEWTEKDDIMREYNKTCLPQRDIGAASLIQYSCPPNDTSSSTGAVSASASADSVASTTMATSPTSTATGRSRNGTSAGDTHKNVSSTGSSSAASKGDGDGPGSSCLRGGR